jgi:CBS domain-containing protein
LVGKHPTIIADRGGSTYFKRDHTLAIRLWGYLKAHGLRAGDVKSSDAVTVQPDEPITRIAELLLAKNVKRVPVVASRQMIGVVSRRMFSHTFRE